MHANARFLSVPEFALVVSLSERTCWNLIRNGTLPTLKVGRRRLIALEQGIRAIEQLARTHRIPELRG